MSDSLRGRCSIVGVAESDLGKVADGLTSLDLVGQATARALDDAGLGLHDVDAIFSTSSHYSMPAMEIGEYLGIRPRYSDSSNIGGASFISHLLHAVSAIDAGLCNIVLIAYGSTQLSDGGKLVTTSAPNPYEVEYGPRYPVSMYAMAAARHMYEFGTTREQLAQVAVAARRWAQLTPGAFRTDPLSIDDVLSSRMVSDPLTVADCCLVTDGGAAVIVTSTDRARDLRQPHVPILGAAEAHWHRNISQMPDLTRTAAAESGPRAMAMAGISPDDVDVLELYDAFTINVILFLEDLGFCTKGEGGPFVEGGRIGPDGELAVNTNGGGLSYTHPGMYGNFLTVEAVRQLRGAAGRRQIDEANIALVHGNGAVLSGEASAVLGSPLTA